MSELTDKRHRQTRVEILEAAMRLFIARGFDETPMSDVADAAGVSRRTVYRHFPSKDDLVFEHPRRWLEAFNRAVAQRAADEPTRELCRRALMEVADVIADDAEAVLAAFSVLTATPSLRVRHGKTDAIWAERVAGLIAQDLADQPELQPQAVIAGGALIGTTNAVIVVWAAGQPEAEIAASLQAGLDQVDSIWPDASRRPPPGG